MVDWTALGTVLLMTVLAALVTAFMVFEQNRQHIVENWVEYRCHPLVMPFAWYFGKDTAENFNMCTMSTMNSYTGYLFEPIHFMFGLVGDIIGDIVEGIDDIRGALVSVRGGFLGIIGTVFGKVQNGVAETNILFIRMRDIMSRLVSVFYVLGYTGMTGVETGQSLMNGPVGGVINYFGCFDPSTPMLLRDGSAVPIADVRVGDTLRRGARVTSTFRFKSEGTTMYDYEGIKVSGNHIVFDTRQNLWVPVERAVNARQLPDSYWQEQPFIYCINTSDNMIRISGHVFRDFEEVGESDKSVIDFLQRMTGTHLNKGRAVSETVTGSFKAGLHPSSLVLMDGGQTLKKICRIQPGDKLYGGNEVGGVSVHEAVEHPPVVVDNVVMLPNTLCRILPDDSLYRRAVFCCLDQVHPPLMPLAYGLVTAQGGFYVSNGDRHFVEVRDDNEDVSESLNDARMDIILEYLNHSKTLTQTQLE